MIKTVILADNLVNDYCGLQERYLQNNVHIGLMEAERLFGRADDPEPGPVAAFLARQEKEASALVLYLRDYYVLETGNGTEQLERLGNHCVKGSTGEELVKPVQNLAGPGRVINNQGLSFPFEEMRQALLGFAGVDLLELNPAAFRSSGLRFLLIGFHTERRIFSIASILRNLFGFRHVAVFSHFLASANKEAHFSALQFQFPDHLIQVLNSTAALSEYMGQDLAYLDRFALRSVHIEPEEIRNRLNAFQKNIIEFICMHWTEARLKVMGMGYSGSALFLANGKQGNSRTEPMVIKIDNHYPIRLEIKGYNLVKSFLGKHVPTLTFPVSSGSFSGVGMELASMEGSPMTLQECLEKAGNDYALDDFLQKLGQILSLLTERIYTNTKLERHIAPYRHFKLHLAQQSRWLKANLANIRKHEVRDIFVSAEAVEKLFDAIRKNNDVLLCEMCIAHGDLNLANIIADSKGNLWTIDWTHTGLHPIAVDFAKMENDVKFVLTKNLEEQDLPKLQRLEEYLLNNRIPAPVSELPAGMQFVSWDLRFKKIYLPVRKLRLAYSHLQQDEEWLMYKIALLRYALHTLSFDKTLQQGECGPVQLWYALASVEILVFLLVGDDFHLKIRSERPDDYPERYRIPIDMANWKVECKEYNPPYYVAPAVLNNSRKGHPRGETDPEEEWVYPDMTDWGREYIRAADGKPLNPSGRTGIAGRGSLWLWGSNPMLFLCPVLYNKEVGQLECLVNTKEGESDIICIHFRRGETFEEALKRAREKIHIDLESCYFKQLFEGYFYDCRQTDHAWVEARAFLAFLEHECPEQSLRSEDLQWKLLNHSLINGLHPSYANLLRSAVQHLYDEGIHRDQFIVNIIEKTA